MKKIIMHTLLKKKHVLLYCEKNKIERKLIFIKSLIFFCFFFSHLVKIWYDKCVVLPSNWENIFYRKLHHLKQRRLSLLIFIEFGTILQKNMQKSVFRAMMIHLWHILTSLCMVIYGSSSRRLFFVIVINSALMSPWLVKNSKKK